MSDIPMILWVRRDLRLADNPMLSAAVATGRPLVLVFILDPETESLGAAPRWRLGEGLAAFDESLRAVGSRLIFRRGPALEVLQALLAETGADAVHWARQYDPVAVTRDSAVKAALKAQGVEAKSHAGHLLFEPWEVETGQGGFYKVYTPMWKTVKDRFVENAMPPPRHIVAPKHWPQTDMVSDWDLATDMRRGAGIVAKHAVIGEAAALARLDRFIDGPVKTYKERRDFPGENATSGLSENLAWGEIGPRTVWHAGMRAVLEGTGSEHFLKELVWREFAYHLIHHTPEIATRNWRPEWDSFPWRADNEDAERWRRGMTGEPFVDAAMREMYVTGRMHNRARMIVASYLTKHLMTDWRVGQRWFEECLIDWDPAANAMGWQWAAGCGPDAAPYFRVFNPATQLEKFDAGHAYRDRFIAEGQRNPPQDALDFFQAVPVSWQLSPDLPYPRAVVDLGAGRDRALAAYAGRNS